MPTMHRHLIAVWAVLIVMTIVVAVAADVTRASRLGAIWLLLIAIVTLAKTRLVLGYYLGLRRNRGALNGMTGAVALTLAIVVAAFVVIRP